VARKQIQKVGDKLTKVNENFKINMYDNGFMIEVGGRDSDDEYKTAKIMVKTVDELLALVKETTELPKEE